MKTLVRIFTSVAILFIFTDSTQAQYCVPHFTTGCTSSYDINDFIITGADSTYIYDTSSGCPLSAYVSRIYDTVILSPGNLFYCTVNSNAMAGANVQVFIDLNNDSIFEASERVGGENGIATAPDTSIFAITPPPSALTGVYRMRVIETDSADALFPDINPCALSASDNYIYGEVHDYTAIIAAPLCPAPSVTIDSITSFSAAANGLFLPSFLSLVPPTPYEYVLDTTDSTSFSPSLPESRDSTAELSFTGLTPGTTYYFFVRDTCTGGGYTSWVKAIFTTFPACPPPSSVFTSNLLDSSATINWGHNTAPDATGYEYVIDTSATDPTIPGTGITDTFVNVTGLFPSTTYYAHVRDSCEPTGNFSSWTTISFITLPACTLPSLLTAANITDTSVVLSWYLDSTTVGLGYEYVTDTNATTLLPINTTTDSIISITDLQPFTTYYVHVRDSCGAGYFSDWTTISFTTSIRPCLSPVAISASLLTDSSVTINWSTDTAFAGATFQYIIDTTADSPAVSGIVTTTNHASANGLTPGIVYYAHVRDSCGPGYFSPWVTIMFTTGNEICLTPAGLSATGITASAATINWVSVAGAYAYEYIINTLVTDTTGGSSVTTATTAGATSLTPATLYYAHVRDSCYAGYLSSWATISFSTLTLGVSNITAHNFEINVFPNPTKGTITVDINGIPDNDAIALLTDITGKTIRAVSVTANRFNIDMTGVSPGIYLLRYTDAKHNQTIRINKQ